MQHLKLAQSPNIRPDPRWGLNHQRGMTLIEWMVSMTIGLILMAGLTTLIAQQSSTQAELEKSSRQIENGRYAMQLLNDDIQLAGYYGEFSNVSTATPASTDACSIGLAVLEGLMAFPVQGYDSPASGLSTCIASANHVSGTDILVVRRVEPSTLTIAAAAAGAGGRVYLQSGLTPSGSEFEKRLATGATTAVFNLQTQAKPGFAAAPAPLRNFLVHIYFVSPCSVPVPVGSNCSSAADGGKPIPTLKMIELSASGAITTLVTTPLVEGIENMQVDYGIDTTGDGSPDGQFIATSSDWPNLMALRIHLLARSNESTVGYLDSKTYTMGFDSGGAAQTVTPSVDSYSNNVRSYKRRLFSQLIRIVNPSSRRDG